MLGADFQRRMTPGDVAFLRDALGDDAPDDGELTRLLVEDEEYRASVLGDPRAFEAATSRDELMTLVSPRLFFEILLRRAASDLERVHHTVERTGSDRVPVFDAAEVAELTGKPSVLHYLATLLASFTKVHSHTERVWVRRGVVRKVRYSDLDVHSMLRLARETDEHERLPVLRRTADLCLFIVGMFPDFAASAHRYPGTGALRAQSAVRRRLGTEEYETVASQMYALAAHYREGDEIGEVFHTLGEHVVEAKKPINFLSEHYLGYKREQLFGAG